MRKASTKSNTFDSFDVDMMRRALTLARRGEGRVEPNPMVGCVVVRNRRIIGEGFHRRFGGPHAEVGALSKCRGSAAGASVYVSLEPCCHYGKTPPCTDALIAARVSRVVFPFLDPNPVVRGGGERALQKAGIKVSRGILQREAAELLAPFMTRTSLGRPYVIAKWAQSLDGKLTARPGESKWISGEASRRLVHRLRARVDAILVGSGTVLADDPLLTARDVPLRRTATRVVLDGRFRIREECRLITTAENVPTLVITNALKTSARKIDRLIREHGAHVLVCPTIRGVLDPNQVLKLLAQKDVTNLMLEGGPTVLSSFLHAGLVDEAWMFVAPTLIGRSKAPALLHDLRPARKPKTLSPTTVSAQKVGNDVLFRLVFNDPVRLIPSR